MGRRGPKPGSGKSGGDRGGRRPLSPEATIRKIEALKATLTNRSEQLQAWSTADLNRVRLALELLAARYQDELIRRADELEDEEDAQAAREAWEEVQRWQEGGA